MSPIAFRGIFPALVTPFSGDRFRVDDDRLRDLVKHLLDCSVGGLVALGSTGEFHVLSNEERRHVAELIVDANGGQVPVVVHTGATSTSETVALSEHANEIGASAVMVVPPYYEPPTWREVVEHYRAVASAIDIPVMLYHIPSSSGAEWSADQIAELASIDGVAYIKDSSGSAKLIDALLLRKIPDFQFFNGGDSLTLYGLVAGATASVWGAANFIPGLAVSLYGAVQRGDLAEARRLWALVWPICDLLESTNYVAAVKAGCEIVGYPMGTARPPTLSLEPELYKRLESLLSATS